MNPAWSMIFFTTLNGTDLSASTVTSWLSATACVLTPMTLALSSASRALIGSISGLSVASMSAMRATGTPCTSTSSLPTKITTVSRGFASTTESGSVICFGCCSTSVVAELTSRKNTRIVNTSIRDVRFSLGTAFLLRVMRAMRRETFMAHLLWISP